MAYNFTTKGQLKDTLRDYGVTFTDDLADRLMQDYDVLNTIVTIIKICDGEVAEQGSEYGRKCAKETAFEHIYKAIKGENNV